MEKSSCKLSLSCIRAREQYRWPLLSRGKLFTGFNDYGAALGGHWGRRKFTVILLATVCGHNSEIMWRTRSASESAVRVFISFSFSLRCKNKRKMKMHKMLKLWFKGWSPDFPRQPIWWPSLVMTWSCWYSTKTYTGKIILDADRRLFVCVRKPMPWRGSAGNVCLVYIEIQLCGKFYLQGRLPVKWTAYEALLYGTYTTKSDV